MNLRIYPLLALLAVCPSGSRAASALADGPELKARVTEIDRLVNTKLAKENLKPYEPISDEVFVRRIYLDVVGRIPTYAETSRYLGDKRPEKRSLLIDELLASDGYVQHFFNYWADILRLRSQLSVGNSQPAGAAYGDWLRRSLAQNKRYDELVREMVDASGKTYENGAVGFYLRDYNMPLDNMAVTTQIFLGTSMVCAQCHNHPFDKWTQMDYYQMAAHTYGMTGTNGLSNPLLAGLFGGYGAKAKKTAKTSGALAMKLPEGVQRKDLGRAMNEILRPLRYNTVLDHSDRKSLALPHDYQYSDAKPKQVIKPAIPASFSKDGDITREGVKPAQAYSQWMTSPQNPRFTLVIANRLWKKVFGMGLIEPVDEITDSTVPSNPQLMAHLEQTMKDLGYDMKAYLRLLYNSESYQRQAHTKEVELGEVYHFPGPLLRRMSAEQIWDSMVALYKPSPDLPSVEARIARESTVRRIEWLDRSLNALSPQEMMQATAAIAKKQQELAAAVRKAQEQLTQATKTKDEDAIRAAKKVVSNQRNAIDRAAEEVVYTAGFRKFAQLAREGRLAEQIQDPEFAREVATAIAGKEGADLSIDEALGIYNRGLRRKLEAQQRARLERDKQQFAVDTKEEKQALVSWESLRDSTMLRAADLRSPAPNGHFLREFGQSDRELVENANEDATVGQALMLLNGRTFTSLLNPFTTVSRTLAGAKDRDELVDRLYLTLFSRRPDLEERKVITEIVGKGAKPGATARGDALWVLLNTRQFYFIQ